MENERKVSQSTIITELSTTNQLLRETQEKLQITDEIARSS
jgi:hypothetical protein